MPSRDVASASAGVALAWRTLPSRDVASPSAGVAWRGVAFVAFPGFGVCQRRHGVAFAGYVASANVGVALPWQDLASTSAGVGVALPSLDVASASTGMEWRLLPPWDVAPASASAARHGVAWRSLPFRDMASTSAGVAWRWLPSRDVMPATAGVGVALHSWDVALVSADVGCLVAFQGCGAGQRRRGHGVAFPGCGVGSVAVAWHCLLGCGAGQR